MKKEEIEKLSKLARIQLSDKEKEELTEDVSEILSFVGEIQEVTGEGIEKSAGEHRNVMREDKKPHEKGAHTEELLEEAPEREGNFIKVNKIL